jgi:hypothetical protein
MAIEFDENGNMQVPVEVILEKLAGKISQLSIEVATLQSANAMLQAELQNYIGSAAQDKKGI